MTRPVPMPDNFPSYASERSLRQLSAQFKVSCETITRWRKELALVIGCRTPWTPDEDAYLRANFRHASAESIAQHLGRTTGAVKGRASNLQLKTGRPVGWQRRELSAPMRAGHSGEAAYLQAFGPIYRCHSDGTPNPIGAYWHWAGQTLSHDEMEEKARAHRERKALLAVAA